MADRKTCIFDMKTWRTGIFDMKTWRTCIFDMKTWRTGFHSVAEKEQRKRIATCWMRATSCRNKHRRLWRLAVAPHPRTQADWVWAAGSAERDLYNETHCKLRSSAAVGTYAPKMSSLKGDLCFPYIVEDDSRSRFAEPRDGEVMLICLKEMKWRLVPYDTRACISCDNLKNKSLGKQLNKYQIK